MAGIEWSVFIMLIHMHVPGEQLKALSLNECDNISGSKWDRVMKPLSPFANSVCVQTIDIFLKKDITVAPDSAVATIYANHTGKVVNQARRPNLYSLAPLKWPLSINLKGATDGWLSKRCMMNRSHRSLIFLRQTWQHPPITSEKYFRRTRLSK